MFHCICRLIPLGLALGLAAGTALAGFSLPYYVFTLDRLDNAIKEAKGSLKPVAYMYSDAESTCPYTKAASEDVMDALKDYCVIVYVPSGTRGDQWESIPPVVRKALTSKEAGRIIPKTIVTDRASIKVLRILPYVRDEQARRKALRAAADEIRFR